MEFFSYEDSDDGNNRFDSSSNSPFNFFLSTSSPLHIKKKEKDAGRRTNLGTGVSLQVDFIWLWVN